MAAACYVTERDQQSVELRFVRQGGSGSRDAIGAYDGENVAAQLLDHHRRPGRPLGRGSPLLARTAPYEREHREQSAATADLHPAESTP